MAKVDGSVLTVHNLRPGGVIAVHVALDGKVQESVKTLRQRLGAAGFAELSYSNAGESIIQRCDHT